MQTRSLLNSRFRSSIEQVDELLAIFRYIHKNSDIPAKDNILRAALTMLISTIDTSVHELVIGAILKGLTENRTVFDISKQTIDIRCILELDPCLRISMVESDLRRRYSRETFQSSRQIESALSAVGINRIWTRLSSRLSKTPDEIKLQLDLMVRRRNQIVHEADLDAFHNRQQISLLTVEDLHRFTTVFVGALFDEYASLG
jgi:hypothetical protein